ncbi:MAG: ABC transporter permease [Armatimonadetes bacterium]|nr:ABC transporter permease [Armatimonadota bacterium]MBM3947551.1 ABC transporter permease [SAR202 cluster bacterium]
MQRPWLWLGSTLASLVLLLALLAPGLAPHDPLRQHRDGLQAGGAPAPPGGRFLLGADSLGRDVLSRLIHGARSSLAVGLGGTAIAIGLALLVGVGAGYSGGRLEQGLMQLTDVFMAFPPILLAVALAAALPQRSLTSLMLVVGFLTWPGPARVFRSETLSLKERLYVEAARALGASRPRILLHHVLPALAPTTLALGSLATATTILLDAGLSFLGVGIPPPHPTWGAMLQEARSWYTLAPWLAFWPGLAVVLSVAAFHFIAFDLSRPARASGAGL